MNKKELGKLGEAFAGAFLKGKGYQILEKNYRCQYGEIDIIARKGKELAFIEVKTRTSLEFGMGREAVDWKKRNHIKNTSKFYLQNSSNYYETLDFQVVEITLEHIKGIKF